MAGPYPDATNTGVPSGVTLTPSGGMTITKAGTVINGANITGSVTIAADDVTIENSKISSGDNAVIQVAKGVTGAVVQNNSIDGQSAGGIGINVIGNGTFTGNNIVGVADGLSIGGGTTSALVQGNYIHNMTGTSGSHFDGIQVEGDASNINIQHNSIINQNGQTSAVMIDPDFGATSHVTVNDNLLVGGGYTIYSARTTSQAAVTDITITNNHMGTGQYGITDFANTSPVYTGNVNDGSTLAAALQSTGSNTSGGSTGSGSTGSGSTGSGSTGSDSGSTGSGSTGTGSTGSGTSGSGSGGTTTPTQPSHGGSVIMGTSGNDHLTGNSQDNTIKGMAGNDVINGGAGNDTIVGGAGRDVMSGGTGNDHFVFNSASEIGKTAETRDVVTDFATGDKIDLSAIDASSKASGNNSFTFLPGDNQAFTHVAGQLAWRTDAATHTTLIQGDLNGDGVHDFELQLNGTHHLTAADFIL